MNCNHRKGGYVADFPNGSDPCYSVIKHRLPSGGLMVRCTRCGEEWHPINFPDRRPATPGWDAAINFETDNRTSEGVTFPIPEVSAQKQIETWVVASNRYLNESIQKSGKISKLEKELEKRFRIPAKFYDRLKLAVKILVHTSPN